MWEIKKIYLVKFSTDLCQGLLLPEEREIEGMLYW